jgi:single-stranded-DNA-specific exonuclease
MPSANPHAGALGSVNLRVRKAPPDARKVRAELLSAGVPEILADLYVTRGVRALDDIDYHIDNLLPVESMLNVAPMAKYLADARERGTRVLIVSDYDCDGATACSVLVTAFAASGMNVGYLVPDRMVHGYGLTPSIVDEAASLDPKPDVIITVDNGISSVAGVERAREYGIDVLVTDHHLAPEVLPPARLIVNPNQAGDTFPSKHIAGCGVAWYVARGYEAELRARGVKPGFRSENLLPFVAIGTVADVVQLDRNNRILVWEGLERIRAGKCPPGITALIEVSKKLQAELTCADIGFGVGPRVNAAGRLAHMGAGIECLTTPSLDRGRTLAEQLDEINTERKELTKELVEAAVGQVEAEVSNAIAMKTGLPLSIVAFGESWHEGVVGVVAGRIKETYHRPTIVMTRAHDGSIKGSGRSIPGFHLKHALDEINIAHPGLLLKFGGHAMAAGMSIDGARLADFQNVLEQVCAPHLTPDILEKVLDTDGPIPVSELSTDTVKQIAKEIWGQGFPEPLYDGEFTVRQVRSMGDEKQHHKFTVVPVGAGEGEDRGFDLVAFNRPGFLDEGTPEALSAAVKVQVNRFRDVESVQLLAEHVVLGPVLEPSSKPRGRRKP